MTQPKKGAASTNQGLETEFVFDVSPNEPERDIHLLILSLELWACQVHEPAKFYLLLLALMLLIATGKKKVE